MTNWMAMQAPVDKDQGGKVHLPQNGVKPKYMAMGSWHADLSLKGELKKSYRGKR